MIESHETVELDVIFEMRGEIVQARKVDWSGGPCQKEEVYDIKCCVNLRENEWYTASHGGEENEGFVHQGRTVCVHLEKWIKEGYHTDEGVITRTIDAIIENIEHQSAGNLNYDVRKSNYDPWM